MKIVIIFIGLIVLSAFFPVGQEDQLSSLQKQIDSLRTQTYINQELFRIKILKLKLK